GQIRWVAQLVAVVAGAVLGRPHPAPLAEQAPWTESQVIRAAQAQPTTDSNDSHSFRTDTKGELSLNWHIRPPRARGLSSGGGACSGRQQRAPTGSRPRSRCVPR